MKRVPIGEASGLENIDTSDRAESIRHIAQAAGINAWDLVVAEYSDCCIATWTPRNAIKSVAVVIPNSVGLIDIPELISAKEPRRAITATGRTYRHAASPETLSRFAATIADDRPGETQLDRIERTVNALAENFLK